MSYAHLSAGKQGHRLNMVGHRVDVEGTDVFELVAFADECRGVACEAGGITGDVDHAGCAGRGNLSS